MFFAMAACAVNSLLHIFSVRIRTSSATLPASIVAPQCMAVFVGSLSRRCSPFTTSPTAATFVHATGLLRCGYITLRVRRGILQTNVLCHCALCNLQIQLALTPSEHNCADPFSRHYTHHPLLLPLVADAGNKRRNLFRRATMSISRFW